MRNLKLSRAIVIIFVLTLLITTFQITVQAKSTEVITYEEDGIYEGISIDSIKVDEIYYGISLVQYSDFTFNYAIMSSMDDIRWQYLADITVKSETRPEDFSLRYLNDLFLVSLSHRNGQVRYISEDGITWSSQILYYQDIVYQEGKYWALDLKGVVFSSEDMINWQQFVSLESSSVAELLAINLAVDANAVVVSHYAPKWGSMNYLNGLETYDINKSIWQVSNGYNGLIGTTLDIISTEKGFILAYQNDYTYEEPIIFYRSVDGINWSLEANKTSLVRDLNPLVKQDSIINELVDVLDTQIYEDSLAGNAIPVKVVLNDEPIEFDQDALLVGGRVYVPVRKIFEVLGGTVAFDQASKLLTGKVGDSTISLKLGDNVAVVNGQTIELDAPAQIINDRTLVPARFIAECLGKQVVWDQNNYIVFLK